MRTRDGEKEVHFPSPDSVVHQASFERWALPSLACSCDAIAAGLLEFTNLAMMFGMGKGPGSVRAFAINMQYSSRSLALARAPRESRCLFACPFVISDGFSMTDALNFTSVVQHIHVNEAAIVQCETGTS